MAKLRTIERAESETAKLPVTLGDRAHDNLKFIRETMERSTHFTAVPGYGGILMGVTAVAASFIASGRPYLRDWLVTWIVEAFLAFSIGLLAMWQKSRIVAMPLVSPPAKKFALSFAPPLVAGIAITLGMWRYEHYEVMPPIWMMCYGAAIVCGGAFSVRAIPVLGWCFIALGAVSFVLPASAGNWMMAGSFGLLHIVFGIIIARKHGG